MHSLLGRSRVVRRNCFEVLHDTLPTDFHGVWALGWTTRSRTILHLAGWHTGQVSGCHNLEAGDPLTGTNIPPVKGANAFTYHSAGVTFFSWFYGAPSI